jgi:hypothetical protein
MAEHVRNFKEYVETSIKTTSAMCNGPGTEY